MFETGVSQGVTPRAHHEVAGHHATRADHAPRKSRFWRHFVEMIVAMVVGMAVLGIPFRSILASLGYTSDEAISRFPEIVCVVMTFNMAVGMVAWMRVRGHGWRGAVEMTLAMYAATGVALGMFWFHFISEDPLLGVMHVLMVPAMLFAMLYRRHEYAYAHH